MLAAAEAFMEIAGKVCQGRGFIVIKVLVLNQDVAAGIPKSFLCGPWAEGQNALSEFPAILSLTNSPGLPGSLTCGYVTPS